MTERLVVYPDVPGDWDPPGPLELLSFPQASWGGEVTTFSDRTGCTCVFRVLGLIPGRRLIQIQYSGFVFVSAKMVHSVMSFKQRLAFSLFLRKQYFTFLLLWKCFCSITVFFPKSGLKQTFLGGVNKPFKCLKSFGRAEDG